MTDNLTALEARDQWLYIAHHWPALQHALAGTSNGGLTGMPSAPSPEPTTVVNLHVSDLLHEITSIVRYYARILEGETTWKPATSHMPALLLEVAGRYGHFTSDADTSHGFTDDAHTLSERVRKTLNPTARPTYIGPCLTDNCDGELKAREENDTARCPLCGTTITRTEHAAWLQDQMADRLLTGTEIIQALKTLEMPVAASTIWRWIDKGKLTEAEEGTGLYALAKAIKLAKEKRGARIVA